MWTRYKIKCVNCGKTTSLRLHIPEVKELDVKFKCLNCHSEMKGKITVDFENTDWKLELERGEIEYSDAFNADFFVEFSNTLPTRPPSKEPLSNILPTIRIAKDDNFFELMHINNTRQFEEQPKWDSLKDLIRAYILFNKEIISKLSHNLVKHINPELNNQFENDFDYHEAFSFTLNYFLYPWINSYEYKEFASWTSKLYFHKDRFAKSEIINFATNTLNDSEIKKISDDYCNLIIRFVDVKEFLLLAHNLDIETDTHVSVEDFTTLKNFYTDCFEFLGRNSHIIFRLQNLFERGNQDLIPEGCPRNVTCANDFHNLDNGRKLDIINLSDEIVLKNIFVKKFDHRLRNGINHYKAKFNAETQIISYFPITRRPDEEHTIKYLEFLKLCLGVFSSVLKFQQLFKVTFIYKRVLHVRNMS